ncbi:MAG TPA: FKBP-type peptidyl-prolyl cis-trans isomerase [Candidatus Acidoferrum sp.]|nr:FKBP-type peptidyl-prolyl cis-trans isomerase [Candidatus Acidoferrum sp.]
MTQPFSGVEALASFAVGRQIGEQLQGQPFPGLNVDALLAGIGMVLRGEACPYQEDELRAAVDELNRRVQRMQKQQANAMAAAGEQFLKQNAQRDGVTTTPSGLQYEVLQVGTGRKPDRDSTVRVHYHGTLVDGTVFDSSIERDEPIEFAVTGVISGWTEALQLMQEGARWKLFIPHELGYGARGAGGVIGPYTTLIFEVELLAVL